MRLTGRGVVKMVAEYYRLTFADLVGRGLSRTHTKPRAVAALLIRKHCPRLSYLDIGKILGGRDHTTIMTIVKHAEQQVRNDPKIAQDVNLLSRRIKVVAPDLLWQVRIIETERHLTALYQAQAEDATRLSA